MTNKDARTPASAQDDKSSEAGKSIGWHKAYVEGSRPDLRVPVRQVHLTNGQSVTLYDTSGPYTDQLVDTDVRRGWRRCGRTGSSPAATPRSTRAVRSVPRTTASSTPRRAAGCAIWTRSSRAVRASRAGAGAGKR